jgi:hypothetical protein
MREVRMRAEKVRAMKPKKLASYLDEHLGKIVIGPGGVPYLVDRHHLARVLLETGASPVLYAQVVENCAALDAAAFWQRAQQKGWVYFFDERGRGPLEPAALPRRIADLRDDPYRSLAWMMRERGVVSEAGEIPFAEFQWANFFRTRIIFDDTDAGFAHAVEAAIPLARSPAAKDLPGYRASPAP